MIKIAIIDDHLLLAQSLGAMLQVHRSDIQVVFLGDDYEALMLLPEADWPEVVLLDVQLPAKPGYDIARLLKQHKADVRIIFLSGFLNVFTILQGLDVGVVGFLPKDANPEEVLSAIDKAYYEELYVAPKVLPVFHQALRQKDQQLSKREIEIIQWIAHGLTHKEIGEKLCISPRTVEAHRNNILQKLHIGTVPELVSYAVKSGMI